MVNVWRPHPVGVSIVTSIPALRLAKRRADGLIGTTEACLQASSNSVGMPGGIVAFAQCAMPPRGLTLSRLRLY
jgi:hypothetical protein